MSLVCDRCPGTHKVVPRFFASLDLCEPCRDSFTRWLVAPRAFLALRPANDPMCTDATISQASEGR